MKNFFRLLIFCVSALVFTGGADAQEDAPSHWKSGLYIGANAGRSATNFSVLDGPNNSNAWWGRGDYESGSTQGVSKSGFVGYNHVFDTYLLGIEAEIGDDILDISVSDPRSRGPSANVNDKFYATATLRAGYIAGPALIYAKGGWGYMLTELSWQDPVYTSYTNDIRPHHGAIFGGGVEYAVTDALSLRAEYLRYQFSSTTLLDLPWPCCVLYRDPFILEPIDSFRLGVTFRLNADQNHH